MTKDKKRRHKKEPIKIEDLQAEGVDVKGGASLTDPKQELSLLKT